MGNVVPLAFGQKMERSSIPLTEHANAKPSISHLAIISRDLMAGAVLSNHQIIVEGMHLGDDGRMYLDLITLWVE